MDQMRRARFLGRPIDWRPYFLVPPPRKQRVLIGAEEEAVDGKPYTRALPWARAAC